MEELSRAKNHKKFSEDVKQMQYRLNCVRYYVSGNWSSLVDDGLFGPYTERAVKGFQTHEGLSASGIYDAQTDHYLRNEEIIGKTSCMTYVPRPTPPKKKTAIADNAYKTGKMKDDSIMENSAPIEVSVKNDAPTTKEDLLSMIWDRIRQIYKAIKGTVTSLIRLAMRDSRSEIGETFRGLARKAIRLLCKAREKLLCWMTNKIGPHVIGALKGLYKFIYNKIRNYHFSGFVIKFLKDNELDKAADGRWAKVKAVGKLKLKAPGIGALFSLKDFVVELFHYDDYPQDVWYCKCYRHLIAALESILLGVLVDLVVGIIVAAVAGTILSAGTLTVVIALLSGVICVALGAVMTDYAAEDESVLLHALNDFG